MQKHPLKPHSRSGRLMSVRDLPVKFFITRQAAEETIPVKRVEQYDERVTTVIGRYMRMLQQERG